jgi:NhaA family Na+:H+ antiporter
VSSVEGLARLTQPVDEDDHMFGTPDSPVVLIEYGDYECPHCLMVHPIIHDLKERLGDRICYVFRHFPISSAHPNAQIAAEAAEAAAAQGRFWEMHSALFRHQGELDEANLIGYAEELGLDMERFQTDLAGGLHSERVQRDFYSGVRSGVNGTPTFFINDVRYDGAWDLESLLEAIEKPLGVRIRLLAQEFMQMAASGGIVLLAGTLLALLLANSAFAEGYARFWEMNLALSLDRLLLSEGLLEWVNDGLMVIFFFVVGLEIKREILTGELADPKHAALPIASALGGMLVPALLYSAVNLGGPGAHGWGVPMATDIAFTLGILTLLGKRVPLSLKVFFAALAIADDLGAVLVIALFYTSHIVWISLGIGMLFLVSLFALNRARVYAPLPYALLGIGLWLAFLRSGIHPTIAGVLLAITIPTRSPPDTRALLAQATAVLGDYQLILEGSSQADSRRQAAAQSMETVADRLQSPARRIEQDLSPWATYLILPIFALANAGVALGSGTSAALISRVSLGVIVGLVFGKPLGITLFAWLAVRSGLADLPTNVSLRQLFAASWLAGIGFTMSLFITGLAFADPGQQAAAKIGILIASLLAGGIGAFLMSRTAPAYGETTLIEIDSIGVLP